MCLSVASRNAECEKEFGKAASRRAVKSALLISWRARSAWVFISGELAIVVVLEGPCSARNLPREAFDSSPAPSVWYRRFGRFNSSCRRRIYLGRAGLAADLEEVRRVTTKVEDLSARNVA